MNRLKQLSLLSVALGFAALANTAASEVVDTTDGSRTVIESVAPLGTPLTYVSGGDGLIGAGATYPTMSDTPANRAAAMNNYDHTWMQYPDVILMQSGSALNELFAIPGVDHGPNPYENLEFRIWGSNSSADLLEEGIIGAIYRDGFDTADNELGHSDDYTSQWNFRNSYTYFVITGGSHLAPGDFEVGTEGEIDALAARTSVPEPGSLLLLAAGIAGLARRTRKQA